MQLDESPGEHTISVVVPVYRGEHTLDSLVAELSPLSKPHRTPAGHAMRIQEILLVNDGGPDRSDVVIRRLEETVPLVRAVWLSRNFGQHAATIAGMSSTGGDWIVTMDEDGQFDPGDIGRMLDTALEQRAQLVYGTPTNAPPHGPIRNLASKSAKAVIRYLARGQMVNFTSFRLMLGEVGRGGAAYVGPGVYLDVALTWTFGRTAYCPVEFRPEGDRPSGYTFRKLMSHFWHLVITLGPRPLRIVSFAGMLAAFAGLVVAVDVLVEKLAGNVKVPGWASLAVIVLVLGGLTLFALGVVAEYVGAAVHMAMGKPLYLITSDPADGPLERDRETNVTMTPPDAFSWVVGRGGLLGRSVDSALSKRGPIWHPTDAFRWSEPGLLREQLTRACVDFAAEVRDSPWQIAWCAGTGVVGSGTDQVDRESQILSHVLDGVATHLCSRGRNQGAIFLASSAGGVYAGGTPVFTERSAVAPLAPYGWSKLNQEEIVRDFSVDTNTPVLVGRLSNLYGPAQDPTKGQGLISQISLKMLYRQPLILYVPLDTIRDYIYADDAGRLIADGLDRLRTEAQATTTAPQVTKILCSHQPVTIGTILAQFRLIAKRPVSVIVGSSPNARRQPRDLRMNSEVWSELDRRPTTLLSAGIRGIVTDALGSSVRPVRVSHPSADREVPSDAAWPKPSGQLADLGGNR